MVTNLFIIKFYTKIKKTSTGKTKFLFANKIFCSTFMCMHYKIDTVAISSVNLRQEKTVSTFGHCHNNVTNSEESPKE